MVSMGLRGPVALALGFIDNLVDEAAIDNAERCLAHALARITAKVLLLARQREAAIVQAAGRFAQRSKNVQGLLASVAKASVVFTR